MTSQHFSAASFFTFAESASSCDLIFSTSFRKNKSNLLIVRSSNHHAIITKAMDSRKGELERLTTEFRQGLAARGTDLRKNDADLLNEADQDFSRSLFVSCGNISAYMNAGAASPLDYAYIIGHVRKVKEFLQKVDSTPANPSKELCELLETL